MRRLLFLLLLLAGVPLSAPLHAQATADQLNRLSLEALTARPSGGGGGGGGRGYERPHYRASYHRSYRPRGYYRSYTGHARRYGGYHRSFSRHANYRHAYARSRYRAAPRVAYHRSYRR